MALRAKYEADFNDFYAATAQATTSLDTWEDKGKSLEAQMDRVATSLSGAPINTDIKAASASMDEFGVRSVKTMDAVADESGGLSMSFGQMGAAIAGAFTVQQVGAFIVGVADAASEIGDLSVKLGISTEAVQRFKYAAEQSGSTIDNVGRSIQTMNNKLSGGSDSTVAALGELGLDLDTLRNSSPEQAFIAIGDAIGGMQNPMDQTRLALELFGKSGVENTQLFEEGIKRVGAETAVMSEETIRRLKDAQDSWSKFGNAVTVYSGEALGAISRFFSGWQEGSKQLAAAANPFVAIPQAIRDFDLTADAAAQSASDLGAMIATIPAPALAVGAALKPVALALPPIKAETENVNTVIRDMNAAMKDTATQVSLVEPKLGTLAQFTRGMARETESLASYTNIAAQSTEVWNSGLTFTSEVVGELTPKLNEVAAAIENVGAQQQALASGPQMGTSAAGSVGVNLGNLSIQNLETAFSQYAARYGAGGVGVGMVGGGAPPDFITWAKSMGLAQQAPAFPSGGIAGGAVTQNINLNGLLGTDDPQTRELIKTLVGDAMAESMRGQRLLSSA